MVFKQIQYYRTATVALLLALLAFQSAGWLTSWLVARQAARQHAWAIGGPPETKRYRTTIASAAFRSARVGNREIRLNGRLYDIRSTVQQADSLVLELYHDVREEALYATLGRLLAPAFGALQHDTAGGILSRLLLSWAGTPFLLPVAPEIRFPAEQNRYMVFPFLRATGRLSCTCPDPPPKPGLHRF